MNRPPHICGVYWRGEFLGWIDSHISGPINLPDRLSREAAIMAARKMNARTRLNDGKDSHAKRQES